MTAERRHDWKPLLLVVGSGAGALFAFSMVPALLWYAGIRSALDRTSLASAPDAVQAMLLAGSLALVGALSLPSLYHGIRWLRGEDAAGGGAKPLGIAHTLALLVLWLVSCWLGQAVISESTWKWAAPVFQLMAIGAPIYLWVRLAAGGIGGSSAMRSWGLLASGMWLSTALALLAEAALGVLMLLAVGIYLVLHPSQVLMLQEFARGLSGAAGLSDALSVLQPLLERPGVFFAALFIFAGITPVVEEAAKSVAIWAVLSRLAMPAEGFVAGVLTGAGFGLVESLLASSSPDGSWAVTLVFRGGSSMMHVAAAAVAGYGITVFRRSHRVAPLLGGYLGAIIIHGLWNAAVVVLGFGGMHLAMGSNPSNYVSVFMLLLGASLLAALCALTPMALAAANRRLRSSAVLPSPVSALEPALAMPASRPRTGPEA